DYNNRPWQNYINQIEEVVIGDGILSISEDAFYNMPALSKVTIGKNVKTIGLYAFSYCPEIKTMSIPESVTDIKDCAFKGNCFERFSVDSANPRFFDNEDNLYYYNDEGNVVLMSYASGKTDTEFEIASNVYAINDSAIYGCDSLTTVTIPGSVRYIALYQFEECGNLKAIEVAENNPNYFSVDGVLFEQNSSGTALFKYPEAKTSASYTVQNNVTTIASAAFYYSRNLKSVKMPDSVKYINSYAFENCSNLSSVELGAKVENIEYNAFYHDKALKSVYIPKSIDYIGDYAFGYYWDDEEYTEKKVDGFKVYYAKGTSAASYIETFCDYWGLTKVPVKLSAASVSLKAGGTKTLKANAGTVKSWVSNKKSVATVKNGKVTALKKGTATITAKLYDGSVITSKITVKTSPKLSKSSVTVKKNKTVSVKITGKASGIKNVYTNTKYAKITSAKTATTLKVKGLKKGTTTLKVKVNGVVLKLKVNVK
ncbi:MAG: leucine-rich repeat protein, partial [Ruminococcus sp.]|nr:leucine-rich repeat protein [Ruminococcus sp.]